MVEVVHIHLPAIAKKCQPGLWFTQQYQGQPNWRPGHHVAASAGDPDVNDDDENDANAYVSGMAAGLAEVIIIHPLDTLKVRMQCLRFAGNPIPNNFASILRPGGEPLSSLLYGIRPAAVRGLIGGAIFLGTNDSFKKLFGATDQNPISIPFIAAAAGTGFLETVIYCPYELCKIQLQVGNHANSRSCLQHLYRSNGFSGAFMGFHALLWGHIVGAVAFFTTYTTIQNYLRKNQTSESANEYHWLPTTSDPIVATIIAGGCGNGLYCLMSHPLDTMQTCIMSQKFPKERYSGLWQCFTSLLREGGLRALMRGVTPNLAQGVPGGAVSMLAYEGMSSLLQR
eukprot:m.14029 g.14029  ORF g.14029 m.14029 type:complete len:340 (-) comp9985_c0_seq1:234-1253(-)